LVFVMMDDMQLTSFATETEPWRERALAFDRVFAAFDPYGAPFRPELGARDLLFPTGPAALTEEQVAAVAHVTADPRTCVCLAAPGEGGCIFELPLTAGDYRAAAEARDWCFIAHALFAVDGRWGVLTSGESHAVLAGPPEVVAAMRVALPDQTAPRPPQRSERTGPSRHAGTQTHTRRWEIGCGGILPTSSADQRDRSGTLGREGRRAYGAAAARSSSVPQMVLRRP